MSAVNSGGSWRTCRCCGGLFRFKENTRWDFGGAYRETCLRCWGDWRTSEEFRSAAATPLPDPAAFERWLTARGGELMPRAVMR